MDAIQDNEDSTTPCMPVSAFIGVVLPQEQTLQRLNNTPTIMNTAQQGQERGISDNHLLTLSFVCN